MKKYQLAVLSTLAVLALSAQGYIRPLSDYVSQTVLKPLVTKLNYPLYRDLRADRKNKEAELEAIATKEKLNEQRREDQRQYDKIISEFERATAELLNK